MAWTAEYFTGKRLENPRLEAEILLGKVLGKSRVQLYINLEQPLQPLELARYREKIKQRVMGTPAAYLIGEKEFMSLPFEVNRQVLIPRPDTEVLVETALEYLGHTQVGPREQRENRALVSGDQAPLIVDVGTGSGNIAIVLARYLPQARILGLDISDRALEIARRNARRHGVEEQVTFYEGDLLAPLENTPYKGQVDLLTANLPYIPSNELPHLMREVLQEPLSALDGGRDGLQYYRRMIPQSLEYLKPGGALIIEIGFDQRKAALKLFNDQWENVQVKLDYGGRERVIYARATGGTNNDFV
ncbi:MAG: peptide chain release factor N(5)-glutamine methyltransferase [Syntrophomonadaceae bacterium]|nr:peptide chain release factor N(5)-glutamine methyltransferase [Syntrophomonadaceae bacterium]